jgi:DNA-binding MarR family transcriptional regulator
MRLTITAAAAGNVNMVVRNAAPIDDVLELLFFGFRGVTAEPDRVLAERGLSRVHHRILYFVGRKPDITPGGLLRILGVSKQALSRPLRELLQQGLLTAAVPSSNRRTKELRLTGAGARLERRLSGSQRRRFARAFRAAGLDAERGWRDVMRLLAGDGHHARRRK